MSDPGSGASPRRADRPQGHQPSEATSDRATSDRANPQRFVGTRRDKITKSFGAIRGQVMGIGDSAARAAKDGARSAPDAVRDHAQGNPVAAGLIAFGAGCLLSSVLPASDAERKAAAALEEHADGVIDPLKQSAQEVAGNLKEPAQQAARSVQDTTEDASDRTAEHARSATSDVQHHAQEATGDVTGADTDSGPGQDGGGHAR